MTDTSNPYESIATLQDEKATVQPHPMTPQTLRLIVLGVIIVILSLALGAFAAYFATTLFYKMVPPDPRSPPHAYGLFLLIFGGVIWYVIALASAVVAISSLRFIYRKKNTVRASFNLQS